MPLNAFLRTCLGHFLVKLRYNQVQSKTGISQEYPGIFLRWARRAGFMIMMNEQLSKVYRVLLYIDITTEHYGK